MEPNHREVIQRCRLKIVEDLDVNDILDYLLQQRIIDSENKERILNPVINPTTKDKARELIDIIPRRGPEAYGVFRESLLAKYPWLVKALDEELNFLTGVPREESTDKDTDTDTTNGTDIAAGISSIHPASTTARWATCFNCQQPQPTCKRDKRIDAVPHVGLKFHTGEYKVLKNISTSTNEYQVKMKHKLNTSLPLYTLIYPGQFPSLRQCPRVGDSYFNHWVVKSVHRTSPDSYTVQCTSIDTGSCYDWEYPRDFEKYCFYSCPSYLHSIPPASILGTAVTCSNCEDKGCDQPARIFVGEKEIETVPHVIRCRLPVRASVYYPPPGWTPPTRPKRPRH